MRKCKRCGGRLAFTLVELLIVILIIAIMVALLLGGLMAAVQQVRMVECQNNLSQIAKAVLAYTTTYNGAIPPTMVTKKNGSKLYWCNLLVQRGLEAQNMAGVDRQQGVNKMPAGRGSVLMCPSSTLEYVTEADNITSPVDKKAQGWCRLGNDDIKTDCSYYWNGYTGTDANYMGRFPSLALDESATPAEQARQVHDIAEIKQRSRMAMVTDGVLFQGRQADKPQRIAARHAGDRRGGGRTNIAFYDGHVEAMDRYPDPNISSPPQAWAKEMVVGFDADGNWVDPTSTPMWPIMSRSPYFECGKDQAPAFLLPATQ